MLTQTTPLGLLQLRQEIENQKNHAHGFIRVAESKFASWDVRYMPQDAGVLYGGTIYVSPAHIALWERLGVIENNHVIDFDRLVKIYCKYASVRMKNKSLRGIEDAQTLYDFYLDDEFFMEFNTITERLFIKEFASLNLYRFGFDEDTDLPLFWHVEKQPSGYTSYRFLAELWYRKFPELSPFSTTLFDALSGDADYFRWMKKSFTSLSEDFRLLEEV